MKNAVQFMVAYDQRLLHFVAVLRLAMRKEKKSSEFSPSSIGFGGQDNEFSSTVLFSEIALFSSISHILRFSPKFSAVCIRALLHLLFGG
jgi:hypothetical protein